MVGDLGRPANPILNAPDSEVGPIDLFADEDDIERASRSLKAISHPLRLKILCTLGGQEVSVQEIVDYVGTSQSNISQYRAQPSIQNGVPNFLCVLYLSFI